MSGTPVENRLTEYWSILDFLNKGIFGTQKQFVEEFATPIQLYRSKAKLEKFKKITQPFILRRLKSDKSIINDLPDKVESNQYCSLATKQAAMYQKLVNETIFQVNNKLPDERKGLVLQMITGLKQICNHPYHFSKEEDMDFENSGKVTMLFNLLETIYENNEKVLIFTQYKQMGDILVQLIEKHFQTNVLFLHGSLSRKERDEMIDKFQTDSSFQTFVLSLKAGGLGLNLTEASNVIHFDLWWNPASEAQATDRAYRIGQTKNVMVYRLICKGTFEEKIDEMLSNKKQLAEMTVVTGDKWVGDLSEKEIRGIFELR
jgi:SNF2 family DNA or RNA helicase